MATASNAKIQIELGQTLVSMAAMTDSGDNQIFTKTSSNVWSGKEGYEPDVVVDGVVTGRNMLSTHTTNDTVTVAGFTANSQGTLHTVTATTTTITRPAGDVAKINSVTMNSSGTIAVVAGVDSATTAFSETRGANGGPPYIPVGSVEIGQIRVTTQAAGAIAASEIFQVDGTHTERFDYPLWTENNIGNGAKADTTAEKYAHIKFNSALPTIHTADVTKGVYIELYTPALSDLSRTVDFVPAEKSHSSSSQQIYGDTIASFSESLGAGSFTALLSDGVTDALVAEKNEKLTVKFFPNRNKAPYVLTQGTVGLSRTFPAGTQVQATVSISSEVESAEFSA